MSENTSYSDRPAGSSGKPPVEASTTEARQAVEPHQLRYMLGFGIAAVVVAFAIIYWLFFG